MRAGWELCRYSYGSNRCAHRMVVAGTCSGERNCLERIAPSYHSRASAPGPTAEAAERHGLKSYPSFDLHLIDLGSPLIGRQ